MNSFVFVVLAAVASVASAGLLAAPIAYSAPVYAAPAIRTYAAAPIAYAAAPAIRTYAAAPIAYAAPVVRTVAVAPAVRTIAVAPAYRTVAAPAYAYAGNFGYAAHALRSW
ncbi:cuticle protein 16.5 [Folsomia candida]|uniref:Uncharacterized protein n=1 Tax=Folsomia candida TaxID=158441 RepID=A0A226EL18_FOLCA|nr:cuticle protein 16.5 [Folsomia candida]OXA58395.1 hypothetical protein Fcan01_08291 [Folsomia candida]